MEQKKIRVRLEPGLEEEVSLLTPAQRVALARKFQRWARQLRVSARIILRDELPQPRPSLKPLPRRRLSWN